MLYDYLKYRRDCHYEILNSLIKNVQPTFIAQVNSIKTLFEEYITACDGMEETANNYGYKLAKEFLSNYATISTVSTFDKRLLSNSRGKQELLMVLSNDLYCQEGYTNIIKRLDSTIDNSRGWYCYLGLENEEYTKNSFHSDISDLYSSVTITDPQTGQSSTTITVKRQDLLNKSQIYLSALSSALTTSKFQSSATEKVTDGFTALYEADLLETQLSNLVNNLIESATMDVSDMEAVESTLSSCDRYIENSGSVSGFALSKQFKDQNIDEATIIVSAKASGVEYFDYYTKMTNIQKRWLKLEDYK